MKEYFELAGKRIKMSDIKNFEVIKTEYIYRPVYREPDKGLKTALFGKKYKYIEMQPYAAIRNTSKKTISIGKNNKPTEYECVNQAGREFRCMLQNVPVLLEQNDGKVSEIEKSNLLYDQLNVENAPAIKVVDTLHIRTNQDYYLYGENITVSDVSIEFSKLKYDMEEYESGKKGSSVIKSYSENRR